MARKPKVTPTVTDQLGNGGLHAVVPAPAQAMHIEAPTEPLRGEQWAFQQTAVPVTFSIAPPQPAPEPEKKPLKIALIGTAPSSRALAPFNDPSWTIWACSPGNMGQLPRIDVWFEIHSNLLWPENRSYGEPYLKWLSEQTFPVYMQDTSQLARATVYPKDRMVELFGKYFFTSSFAWMLALAIDFGANEIALYGIDMASRDEYILQRPGGHYFIELARQRGIKVTVPPESDLAQPPPLYGYSEANPFGRKLAARRAEIKGRIAQMAAERDRLVQQITYLQGAEEDIDYIQNIWTGVGD
jgi:hypothetical protein